MYPRTEYEMSESDLKEILEACRPVPCMMIGGILPPSPQERANAAWAVLGKKMGFDPMSVRPIEGKGDRFFTAVPCETEGQRQAREAEEEIVRKRARAKELLERIRNDQAELDALWPKAMGGR